MSPVRNKKRGFEFIGTTSVVAADGGAAVAQSFQFAGDRQELPHLYVHFGRYQDSPALWTQEEITEDEITEQANGTFEIKKTISLNQAGEFGFTILAEFAAPRVEVWSGKQFVDDARLDFAGKDILKKQRRDAKQIKAQEKLRARIIESSKDFERFLRLTASAVKNNSLDALRTTLFELSSQSSDLQSRLSHVHDEAEEFLKAAKAKTRKERLRWVLNVLENIGIGEIVFISPEGPHAAAGGLAHVITGLMTALNQSDVSATLISPLYDSAQGSRHASAEDYLKRGVRILGKNVKLEAAGRVCITFGATHHSGTNVVRRFARRVWAEVYKAELGKIRIFFLHHRQLARELYPEANSDEQLRQAIFLSRGALEIMSRGEYGIAPHVVITNDWLTGLVPALLKTDARYSKNETFRDVGTVHILHNAGRAYQGLLYVNQYGEDLWPMLELAPEHFFGLTDPNDSGCFNLTAAALLHVTKGIIAVSRPYAEELFTEKGGEGLQSLFLKRSEIVFGISNGIDVTALRSLLWEVGERARSQLGLEPLPMKRFTERRVLERLSKYKTAIKRVVQKDCGLEENSEAVLVSFVGRVAEQKGIALLSAAVDEKGTSCMEAILKRFSGVQFFLGGPPARNDATAKEFIATVSALKKKFPGRINARFEFIPHATTLEITGASDIFLMPSRYEPGGISQLEALAAGTVVVARNVGGISATLENYGGADSTGSAFLFEDFSAKAFYTALVQALDTLQNKKQRKQLVQLAASAEHDWAQRTDSYLALLQYVSGVFGTRHELPYLGQREELIESIRPGFRDTGQTIH